eukprot:3101403-Amphidinium_carterae.1
MNPYHYLSGKSAAGQTSTSVILRIGGLAETTCGAVCAIGRVIMHIRLADVAAVETGRVWITWFRRCVWM